MARLLSPGSAPDAVEMALARWNRSRFEWGQTDCFQSVLAHVEFVTGRAFNRPRYSSAIGAERILRRAGGFERYCSEVMETLGCPTTVNPERGDVGLIDLPRIGLTFCLCTGQKWAARAEAMAVLIIQAEPVIAWRVMPCPRP
jgi:hypothetical protein